MSRIIQDSDDELEDDLEVDVQRPEKEDASPKQATSDTSSTEALRKQIEAAHRAHLQSQFSANDGHAPVVVNGTRQKGKASLCFDSNSTSNGQFLTKDVPVTHGKLAKTILPSSSPVQQQDQDCLRPAVQPTDTANRVGWVLDGTMRDAYAQHNPNAMFPEPSSTVPNATLTQQRVLEGVLATTLLGSDIDASTAAYQPDASIPWSEYLKSPSNTGERPRSSAQEPHVSQITFAPAPGLPLHELPVAPPSQRSRRGSLTLVGSPLAHRTWPAATGTEDITSLTEDTDQSVDVLSLAVDGLPQEELPGFHRTSRKKRPSPVPTLDDDLADLGVLKEEYKPRPSRSRSVKVGTQESIDYSIRPENATKASKRRRSTPATASTARHIQTPNKVQQICDMGFTPSTSERALKQNNGDVIRSVDWLITNRIADDELISHNSQMSRPEDHQGAVDTDKRGRRRVQLQTNRRGAEQTSVKTTAAKSAALDHNAASTEPDTFAPLVDARSPAKVQVVIPTKSPRTIIDTPVTTETSRKKAKRRKTTLDPPEPIATHSAANEAKAEKKRGRGRPKKAFKASMSTKLVQGNDTEIPGHPRSSPLLPVYGDTQLTTRHGQATEHTTAATTMKASEDAEMTQPQDTATGTVIFETTPGPLVPPDRPEVEPITPEPVKKLVAREQPSNNRTKAPYRVGLSKRAKIAPLLRVMKR